MTPDKRHDFEQRLRALYRSHAGEVDTATAARLREARKRALEAAERPRLARWLMPMGAVAACLLAAVVIWPSTPHTTRHAAPASTAAADNTLPPDPDNADPAMYQNLDFYAWLADQSNDAAPGHRGG